MLTIRKITPEDSRNEISNIYEQSWRAAYAGIVPQDYLDSIPSGRWASKVDSPGWITLVCEIDGKIVGTSSVCKSRFKEYPDDGEIISLYFLPEYMHKGFGKFLLAGAVRELSGYDEIFLWVLEENASARRFYESQGFVLTDGYLENEIGGKMLREVRYKLSNKPSVEIIREINTSGYWWCDSAVMFSVRNGKNTIFERFGHEDANYEYSSQMIMDGKLLAQARLPACPTCKGMLAAGYGIENVDCPELKAARECMNSKFVSITDSAEKIKPLLGLLGDGYYVLADTICLPSNGEGSFFYDIPDGFKQYESVCDGYYCNWNFHCIRSFPLFLYPTQSSSLINNERVEYYAQMMKSGSDQPRALAYSYTGFFNLLLDGHHKACAAASLGKYVRCLTIIAADGCMYSRDQQLRGIDVRKVNPRIEIIMFGEMETEADPGMRHFDIYGYTKKSKEELSHPIYDLTPKTVHYGPDKYPTVRDLMILMNPGLKIRNTLPDIDTDVLESLLYENTDEADTYLETVIRYLAITDHDKAYTLAGDILKIGDDRMRHRRVRSALLFFLDNKSDETEQIMVDFYLSHKEHDENWRLVNTYWKSDF